MNIFVLPFLRWDVAFQWVSKNPCKYSVHNWRVPCYLIITLVSFQLNNHNRYTPWLALSQFSAKQSQLNITTDTLWLTCEGESWGIYCGCLLWLFICVLCEFTWRSEFYRWQCCALCNTNTVFGYYNIPWYSTRQMFIMYKKGLKFQAAYQNSLSESREKWQQSFIDQTNIRNKLFLSFT